jgi:hypothetical protein
MVDCGGRGDGDGWLQDVNSHCPTVYREPLNQHISQPDDLEIACC